MLFTKMIRKIVTGALLTTFIVGHMGEICVYAAEGDGSLSENAAEEALLENSTDDEEGLSDDQVVTGDETVSEDNAGYEKDSDSENVDVSEDDTVLEDNTVSGNDTVSDDDAISQNDILLDGDREANKASEEKSSEDMSDDDEDFISLPYSYETDDYSIAIRKTNSWPGGYQGEIILENTSDKTVRDWSVSFVSEDDLSSVWNAVCETKDDHICLTGESYNSVIEPGDSVTIGFQASGESGSIKDVNVEFDFDIDNELGDSEEIISTEPYIFEYDGYTVSYKVTSHWSENCNVSVTVTNTSDEKMHNWNLTFVSDDEIVDPYNAKIIGEGSGNGKWIFKNAGYNQDISAGGSVEFGFQVHFGKKLDIPKSFYLTSGEFDVRSSDYSVNNNITSTWEEGYTGSLNIKNLRDTDIEDWVLTVQSEDGFNSVWGATFKKTGENLYEIECPDYAQNILAYSEANIGYQMDDHDKDNDNEIIVMGLKERRLSKASVSVNKIELDIPEDMFDGTSSYEATGGWIDIGEAYFKDLTKEEQVAFSPEGFEYFKNQLLIYATEGYSFDEIEAFAASHQMVIVGYLEGTASYQLESVVDLDWDAISALEEEFEKAREVESVAYNYISEIDPEFEISDEEWADDIWDSTLPLGDNWSMEAIDWEGALVNCGIAPDHSASSGEFNLDKLTPVKIGVMDSKFDEWHEDLDGNIVDTFNNCDEFGELIYINNNNVAAYHHGTHVAGIIGAEFDNGMGISGVCLKPELYLCSFDGETDRNCDKRIVNKSPIYKLKYFLEILIENNVKVINYSMGYKRDSIILSITDPNYSKQLRKTYFGDENSDGGLFKRSQEVEKLLKKEINKGYDFLIVTAAGNANAEGFVPWTKGSESGIVEIYNYNLNIKKNLDSNGVDKTNNTKYDFSASFGGRFSGASITGDVRAGYTNDFAYIADEDIKSHIMVVGAIGKPGDNISGKKIDSKYYNTDFSNVGPRVDVVAPGVSVQSCAVTGYGDDNGNYTKLQGTSMASPIVAGMAGFILSVDPGLSCSEVKKRIIESAKEYSYDYEHYDLDLYRYPVANLGNVYENSLYFNVKNENEAILKNATIELYDKAAFKDVGTDAEVLYSGITDDKGYCCIKAKGSEYVAVASLEEYQNQTIDILPNQTSYEIIMQPAPVTEHYDYVVVLDYSTSKEDLDKQKEIALEIINNMKEGDRITFAYTITQATVAKQLTNPKRYYWTQNSFEALEMMDIYFNNNPFSIFNSNFYSVENTYTGGFYWGFTAINSITDEFSTNKRKVYIFYPGSRYDSTISQNYSNIKTLMDQMTGRGVEINTISVSYESNSDMDGLVKANGGTVYDETKGIDYVKAKINEDLKKRLEY